MLSNISITHLKAVLSHTLMTLVILWAPGGVKSVSADNYCLNTRSKDGAKKYTVKFIVC